MHQHDTDLLARLPLFSKVDLVSVRPILGRCEEHEFPVGHLLIDPKRGSAVAYVLLHGRLTVHLGPDQPPIATLEREGDARSWGRRFLDRLAPRRLHTVN